MTSEFRDEVWVPIAFSCSSTTTSRPSSARRRAAASPTTPAPITTASTSMPSSSSDGPPTYLVRRERQNHFACSLLRTTLLIAFDTRKLDSIWRLLGHSADMDALRLRRGGFPGVAAHARTAVASGHRTK